MRSRVVKTLNGSQNFSILILRIANAKSANTLSTILKANFISNNKQKFTAFNINKEGTVPRSIRID